MLDTPLLDRTGAVMKLPDGGEATIRLALFMAIDAQLEGDPKMDVAAKLKLAKLSLKLADENAELAAGEITTLLERSALALTTLVYQQLVQTLDPKALD